MLAFHINGENRMTKLKLMSVRLIAAATLGNSRYGSRERCSTSAARPGRTIAYRERRTLCRRARLYPGPAVGAFATQPWDNGPPCDPRR